MSEHISVGYLGLATLALTATVSLLALVAVLVARRRPAPR